MTHAVLYKDTSMLFAVAGLADPLTHEELVDATVTLESLLAESDAAPVSGITVPADLTWTPGKSHRIDMVDDISGEKWTLETTGYYVYTSPAGLGITVGQWYVAKLKAVSPGGKQSPWTIRARAETRAA